MNISKIFCGALLAASVVVPGARADSVSTGCDIRLLVGKAHPFAAAPAQRWDQPGYRQPAAQPAPVYQAPAYQAPTYRPAAPAARPAAMSLSQPAPAASAAPLTHGNGVAQDRTALARRLGMGRLS